MNDYITLPLTRGFSTTIDYVDSEFCVFIMWSIVTKGKPYVTTRLNLGENYPKMYLHRLIMEKILSRKLAKNELVDHWDNNSLNNRRDNLRLTSKIGNAQNSKLRSDSSTGLKGVTKLKTCERWMAQITVNKKHVYLGLFTTPEAAHEAYCTAAKEHFKEFARFE